jgi:hypothetical protein
VKKAAGSEQLAISQKATGIGFLVFGTWQSFTTLCRFLGALVTLGGNG